MGNTFKTGNYVNAIFQDSSNNIGIGAANSSYKFQVTGTTNLTDALTGTSATFSTGVALSSAGGSNQLTSFVNTSSLHSGSAGLNVFGFNGSNNIYFGKGLTNGGVFLWTNSEVRYYTLPNATGTLALTSDLGSYLPLSGGTLTGALSGTSATFSTQLKVSNPTGSALDMLVLETGFNNPSGNKSIIWKDATNTLGRISVSYDAGTGSTMRFGSLYNSGYQSSDLLTIASSGAATFSSSVTASDFKAQAGGIGGYASLRSGGAGAAGYMEIFKPGAVRLGYIGYDLSNLVYSAENSANHVFQGGNVGIGTSSPSRTLEIAPSTAVPALRINNTSPSGNAGIEILTASSKASWLIGAQYNVDQAFEITPSTANGGTTFSTPALVVNNNGKVIVGATSTTYGSRFASYSASGAAPVGVFQNANNVSGDTCVYFQMSPNARDTSSYYLQAFDTTQDQLYIYGNGNVVNRNNSYGTLSDATLKENIVDATPKLADILQLKVRNFNLIGDENKQIGFIAQEFEEVFPSMIDIDGKSGKKAIKTSVLVPMLVKAIQELKEEIETLKNK